MKPAKFLVLAAVVAFAQPLELFEVQSRGVERSLKLPGELLPYEAVELHARVQGYVERMLVDRGTRVAKNQLIAQLSAPEMAAQVAEAAAKVHSVESEVAEAQAKLASVKAAYDRIKSASETPGAVAGLELVRAKEDVDAAEALVKAKQRSREAAQAALDSVRKLEAYLEVRAPFAGIVTERFLHPGALVSPSTGPLVRIEQVSHLRLVLPVPEGVVGGISPRERVTFSVPAHPGARFPATIARIPRSVDAKTRTMPVELDVPNANGKLAPGMYPEVTLPVKTSAALLVPPSAVVTTTERTFVIRVVNRRAEWVDVRRGPAAGTDLIEVYGPLVAGDAIVKRASDEIRQGARIEAASSRRPS